MTDRVVRSFCAAIVLAIVGGVVASVVVADVQLLRRSTLPPPYPMTIYEPLPTPGSALSPDDKGAAGADFSQVYTSAKALRHGQSAYRPKSKRFLDHWGRPPGYPPLMNWVAVPISLLSYANALTLYSLLSGLGLLGVTAWLLWRGGAARHILPVAAAQTALYLLTPIGVTHLERGQFDLVVAITAALAVGCAMLPRAGLGMAIACGLLGALKWTSVSFLGCFAALGFLLGHGRKRAAFFAIPVAIAAGTFPFYRELLDYWTTIQVYEIDATPYGLTLQHFLPRNAARAVPVVMTLLLAGLVFYRSRSAQARADALGDVGVPFSMALMNAAVCFGTLSYEYHTVSTLGVMPGLVLWVVTAERVADSVKAWLCGAFAVFAVIVFRTYGVGASLSPETLTGVYVALGALFFAIAAALALGRGLRAVTPAH